MIQIVFVIFFQNWIHHREIIFLQLLNFGAVLLGVVSGILLGTVAVVNYSGETMAHIVVTNG